jgi:hypothetical protein
MAFKEFKNARLTQEEIEARRVQDLKVQERKSYRDKVERLRRNNDLVVDTYLNLGSEAYSLLQEFSEAIDGGKVPIQHFVRGKYYDPQKDELIESHHGTRFVGFDRMFRITRPELEQAMRDLHKKNARAIDRLSLKSHLKLLGADYGKTYEVFIEAIGIFLQRASDGGGENWYDVGVSIKVNAEGVFVNGERVTQREEIIAAITEAEKSKKYVLYGE